MLTCHGTCVPWSHPARPFDPALSIHLSALLGTLLVSLTPLCSDLDSTCAQLACPLAPQDLAWHLGLDLLGRVCEEDGGVGSRRGLRPSESLARLLHLVKVLPLSLCSEYVPGVTL